MNVPTVNMDIADAPRELEHGIYVCRITLGTATYGGAMHFGPRPVFGDDASLEVHVLDAVLAEVPGRAAVEVLARIRDVRNFPDAEALKRAIADDIAVTRAILKACP